VLLPVTGPISHSIPVSPQSPGMIPASVTSLNTDMDTDCASLTSPSKDLTVVTIPSSQLPASTSTSSISPACAAQTVSMPAPMPAPSLLPPSTHTFPSVHTVTSAVQMCDFPTLFEDVTWLKNHPRPLAVSNRVLVIQASLFSFVYSGPFKIPKYL
jgi:hypothetical protein